MAAHKLCFQISRCLYVIIMILISISNAINVTTSYGTIEGFENGNVNRFTNIPFAQPPIGNLRFQPPQPMDPWNDTWNGQEYGNIHFGGKIPGCPQIADSFGPFAVTEDCLYLNVYTPKNTNKTSKHAVMIWIYGGSFLSGWSTGGGIYDPTETLNYINDIIIVAINYRVGLFGSLYDSQYNTNINGNQGYLDQVMAIQWVYDEIENFGGDKERITIYGESAGAHSVALHLLYNNEHISSGIMESPPIGMPLRDTETWYDCPQQMNKLIGCDNYTLGNESVIDCWQSVDWTKILFAQFNKALLGNFTGGMPYTPTVGTKLIPFQPVQGFMNISIVQNVPRFIVGVNANESFSFLNTSATYTYDFVYDEVAKIMGKDNADLVFDYYEIDENTQNMDEMYARIGTDSSFRCPVRNVTVNGIGSDAWYYHFDAVDKDLYKTAFSSNNECWNRTCHAAELFYLWLPQNFTYFLPEMKYNEETINIGHKLQKYWTNFAKNGDPNGKNAANDVWVKYEEKNRMFLQIVDDNVNRSVYVDEAVCDFWDRIGYAGDYCGDCKLEKESNENNGMSGGVIAGIVICVLCVLVIIGLLLWKFVLTGKRENDDNNEELMYNKM